MSGDADLLALLRGVAHASKRIAAIPAWQESPHKSTTRLRLVAALEIDGIVQEGLFLMGRTLKRPPETDLTFVLHFEYGRVAHQLGRLDWRPKSPHTDTVGPISGRASFAGSNWHSFAGNSPFGLSALRAGPVGNLPRAEPLLPDPPNLKALLVVVRELMYITNAEDIPEPPWDTQGQLL